MEISNENKENEMKIVLAHERDFDTVRRITQTTIKQVYPRYYPVGAVDFFSEHHSDANIREDISKGKVYVLNEGDVPVGTVTICEENIYRLFVLPESQHKGFGKALLDFAEEKILESYDHVKVDASFPAKRIYKMRGYKEIEYNIIKTENGDYLCFDVMRLKKQGRIVLYTDDVEEYLKSDDIIDYHRESVAEQADKLFDSSVDEVDFIRKAYEYVRDNFAHSADAGEEKVTCSASEVLAFGHGICFAKSHLLAAILRSKGVPAGFCYQKLILDDETAPILIYHGLNGVYISSRKKWIRLDARGNKPGVDAQFSIDKEQLAFEIRPERGEEDCFIIYPDPDTLVVKTMREGKTRSELWDNLPAELGYDKQ